jgi:hypothetical protein
LPEDLELVHQITKHSLHVIHIQRGLSLVSHKILIQKQNATFHERKRVRRKKGKISFNLLHTAGFARANRYTCMHTVH